MPPALADLIGDIDLIICDLWGVVHDGHRAHPCAVAALKGARAAGKIVILLTNAPKPVADVARQIARLGVPDQVADGIVTSGHLARQLIRTRFAGAALYHLGPARDAVTVAGLPGSTVTAIDAADLILATGPTDPAEQDIERDKPLLAAAAARSLPLICANPDRVVHVGDRLVLCAGQLGDHYEGLGGPVIWAGKPYPIAFDRCVKLARDAGLNAPIDAQRTLVIGDSMTTDIAGAVAGGYHSLLISSGIHRDDFAGVSFADALAALRDRYGFAPDAVSEYLC